MPGGKRRPLLDRFWEKVDRSGGPGACWPWRGAHNADRYGVFRVVDAPTGLVYAHRMAYALEFGPIAEGVEIMHKCPAMPRPRDCCNPAHLAPGSHAENCAAGERVRRGKRFGGAARQLVAAIEGGA